MTAQASKRDRRETRGAAGQSAVRTRRAPHQPAVPAVPTSPQAPAPRPKKPASRANHGAPAKPATPPRRASRSTARYLLPPVAPCDDLMALFALEPAAARDHVDAALHAAMPAAQADTFEARSYRWELHLVALDQVCLLRGVDLVPSRIRRYRTALRRGASCAPLIGLGGEGKSPAEDVLLCDGYHRAIALRDTGIHYAWVWLAVGAWRDANAAGDPVA